MFPSRYVHMFPKQRDLMGFDEVGPLPSFLAVVWVTSSFNRGVPLRST